MHAKPDVTTGDRNPDPAIRKALAEIAAAVRIGVISADGRREIGAQIAITESDRNPIKGIRFDRYWRSKVEIVVCKTGRET